MTTSYRAVRVHKQNLETLVALEEIPMPQSTPRGFVLIKVLYSSINFKDIMAVRGNPAVTRRFPHTPGVDAAGEVVLSRSKRFPIGSKVIVYCRQMGMNCPGGFAEYVCVPIEWIETLPSGLDLKESMVFGTAGFTAGLTLDVLSKRYKSLRGKSIAVTGASSGLGAMAVAMLHRQGCNVTALVSRGADHSFLLRIGAKNIEYREEISNKHSQNLLRERYDAIIDVAGGELLAHLLKQIKVKGVAVSAGMSSDTKLPINVLPFILRAVTLFGVNAESLNVSHRKRIWNSIAFENRPQDLASLFEVISLADLPGLLRNLKEGQRQPTGRVVVACS